MSDRVIPPLKVRLTGPTFCTTRSAVKPYRHCRPFRCTGHALAHTSASARAAQTALWRGGDVAFQSLSSMV